jgi:hypothetical protein
MGGETQGLGPYIDCYRQRTTDGHNPLGYFVLAGFGRLVHVALEYYRCDWPKAKAFSKATKLLIDHARQCSTSASARCCPSNLQALACRAVRRFSTAT